MTARPICLALWPFGRKPGPDGTTIDFDLLRMQVLKPAVEAAGMVLLSLDAEGPSMYREAIGAADICVAEVSFPSPIILFTLRLREALAPDGALLIAAAGASVPTDLVTPQRLTYPGPPASLSES